MNVISRHVSETLKTYTDGTLADQNTAPSGAPSSTNEAMTIGCHAQTLDEYLDGEVDDVMVYNRALSGTEVEDIYGGSDVATGLQARWKLDDAVTRYALSGNQVLAEYTADDDGVMALSRKFVYGAYIDEPLMMINTDGGTETEFYYHRNRNYNVIALTDENGNEVERYTYSAYGEVVVLVDGGTGNPYFFTGRRLDDETGLMYYRARYYDGELGRFVGRDPLGYVDGANLYCYTANCPTFYQDPYGTKFISAGGKCRSVVGPLTGDVQYSWYKLQGSSSDGCTFDDAPKYLSDKDQVYPWWSTKEIHNSGIVYYTKKAKKNCEENDCKVDCYKLTVSREFTMPVVVYGSFIFGKHQIVHKFILRICADGINDVKLGHNDNLDAGDVHYDCTVW